MSDSDSDDDWELDDIGGIPSTRANPRRSRSRRRRGERVPNSDSDDDNDGLLDTNDPFPLVNQPNLIDTDSDGLPDTCDANCVGAGLTEDLDDDDDSECLKTLTVGDVKQKAIDAGQPGIVMLTT
mgnify:CR=1 FL=1